MIVAILALVIALGGTAAAKFGPFKGDKIIKKKSLSGNRLKNHTVTANQIKLSSLNFASLGNGTLPSRVTLRGAFSVRDLATGAGEEIQQGISFGFSLKTAPAVHYVNFGTAPPAGCTGGTAAAPTADPGNLCIYEGAAPNNSTTRGEFDAVSGTNNVATTFGAAVFADSAAAGQYRIRGSWAVTAP